LSSRRSRLLSIELAEYTMITLAFIRTWFFRWLGLGQIRPTPVARIFGWRTGLVIGAMAVAGCQEPPVINAKSDHETDLKPPAASATDEFILQSGDTIKVSFPSASNLDTSQQIRTDGRLNLPIIGEIVASGKTTGALQKELETQYSTQLVSKEVSVTVVSAPFSVFVTGAVLKPGKIVVDHQISALEAIMEAGGFDTAKANMSGVVVLRQGQGSEGNKSFTLDLKQVLEGKKFETFYLRRYDIVNVPEKFTWF